MIEVHPITSEAEWLERRRQDVTASEVGALFGVHPYKTALELWAEKCGVDLGRRETSVMRRGRILEPAVAEAVRIERPNWIIEPARAYYRDAGARIGATPDFQFWDRKPPRREGIIQAKVVSPRQFEEHWTADSPPFWIVLQAAQEMMLTNRPLGAVAALIIDAWTMDVAIYEIERHEAAEARIRAKVAEFWKAVDAREQPPADFDRDGEALAALYPRERDEYPDVCMSADDRVRELLAERRALMPAKRDIARRLGRIKTELQSILKDAESAYGPDWRITWKTQTRASRYEPGGSSRVLRITDRSGKTETIDHGNEDQDGGTASGDSRGVRFF